MFVSQIHGAISWLTFAYVLAMLVGLTIAQALLRHIGFSDPFFDRYMIYLNV